MFPQLYLIESIQLSILKSTEYFSLLLTFFEFYKIAFGMYLANCILVIREAKTHTREIKLKKHFICRKNKCLICCFTEQNMKTINTCWFISTVKCKRLIQYCVRFIRRAVNRANELDTSVDTANLLLDKNSSSTKTLDRYENCVPGKCFSL